MGRSVMVPGEAFRTVFTTVDIEDSFEFTNFLDDVRAVIQRRYPSFKNTDRWAGRETHIVLESEYACVAVCEYMGLVSINLVAKPSEAGHERTQKMCQRWEALVSKAFGGMTSLGYASKGEQFFLRA